MLTADLFVMGWLVHTWMQISMLQWKYSWLVIKNFVLFTLSLCCFSLCLF